MVEREKLHRHWKSRCCIKASHSRVSLGGQVNQEQDPPGRAPGLHGIGSKGGDFDFLQHETNGRLFGDLDSRVATQSGLVIDLSFSWTKPCQTQNFNSFQTQLQITYGW